MKPELVFVWPPTAKAFARWFVDPDPPLRLERVKLCDLLIGRMYRRRAAEELEKAIIWERLRMHTNVVDALGLPLWSPREVQACLSASIALAAHYEWIAVRSELGEIRWGGRADRDYCSPEDDDDDQ